eukprot:TRINITY_DN1015_c0_g1_i3.p2 TRINITY_DN1015_c0_g1~~TRINITY_DN1015_c0_g1_i3.p2  ORF type:complete len:253 (+),score=80.79 TRINITY_DN1015_c0_g1_i3:1330-2088(+)
MRRYRLPAQKVPHRTVYERYPGEYQQLIGARQDRRRLLPDALRRRAVGERGRCAVAVDVGAGTGKLTAVCAAMADFVLACDSSPTMLQVLQQTVIGAQKVGNVDCVLCDVSQQLPFRPGVADAAVAGWCVSEVKAKNFVRDDWALLVRTSLLSMQRVLVASGSVVLLETLGFGEEPRRSGSHFYKLLVDGHFEQDWLRTDYGWEDHADALRAIKLFFHGNENLLLEQDGQWVLPECTGVWYGTKETLCFSDH